MTYRVILQPQVEVEIAAMFRWIAMDSPGGASTWLDGLEAAIRSLDRLPRRCGLAPESEEFEGEIRQLLFGPRGHACRLLFVIRGEEVHVLHFRHWARDTMRKDEI